MPKTRLKKKKIIIITCGKFKKKTTKYIMKDISAIFHVDVDFMECSLDVSQFYNPARRQYNADLVQEAISNRAPEGYLKYMSLFRGDLFIPILTYIFGQAQLNGSFGISSLFRLRNELYGLEEDRNLMLERFSKVVIHELGHTFGLIHCTHPVCIMRSSTYVEDLDQKELRFCKSCQEKLDASMANY
ncbi:MAG: archaemetzincin family Zn-dependent metalloprotease [Bacteroidales bacterium]|jgi:archaemetzincin|nr:archaemetzincin family Zn-dependent metalloprotease [Bacteroidales bacterium]